TGFSYRLPSSGLLALSLRPRQRTRGGRVSWWGLLVIGAAFLSPTEVPFLACGRVALRFRGGRADCGSGGSGRSSGSLFCWRSWGLPRYLGPPNNSAGRSTEGSRGPPTSEADCHAH